MLCHASIESMGISQLLKKQPCCLTVSQIHHMTWACCLLQTRKLSDNADYKAAHTTVVNKIRAKSGPVGGNRDPQDNTVADSLSREQYLVLMDHMLHEDEPQSVRDRSVFSWLVQSVGRADEGRMLHLADAVAPIPVECIGAPCPMHISCAAHPQHALHDAANRRALSDC